MQTCYNFTARYLILNSKRFENTISCTGKTEPGNKKRKPGRPFGYRKKKQKQTEAKEKAVAMETIPSVEQENRVTKGNFEFCSWIDL